MGAKTIKAQKCTLWILAEKQSWPWWVEHVSEGFHWVQTQHGPQRYDGYWWHYCRMQYAYPPDEIAAWEESWVEKYGPTLMEASLSETMPARDRALADLLQEGWNISDLYCIE